jgi:hypothetical protein
MKLLLAGRRGASDPLSAAPEPALPWLQRVEAWCEEAAAPALEEAPRIEPGPQDAPVLRLRLHPAASEVSLLAASQERIVVSADTSAAGPGYHRYLVDLLKSLSAAHGITWAPPDEDAGVGDATGYFHSGDASAVEPAFLAWLQQSVNQVLAMRSLGSSGFALSMRFGHTFQHPGALLTPLGPRDESWLREVHDDPRRGTDIFPWWSPGLDATERLNRARCRLWTDVVWRPPLLEEERQRLRDVARLLEQAWREDPTLPYPWREWQEVLGYLGQGGTVAEEVHRRALESPGVGPSIGYRRGSVQVALPQGWEIRIPGSLAEARLQDGSWVARDHRRTVRVVPLEDSVEEQLAPTSPERRTLELEHHGARVSGRASLHVGPGECRLTALCRSGRRRALCVVSFDDPDEQDWALGTWRSLDFAVAA